MLLLVRAFRRGRGRRGWWWRRHFEWAVCRTTPSCCVGGMMRSTPTGTAVVRGAVRRAHMRLLPSAIAHVQRSTRRKQLMVVIMVVVVVDNVLRE